MNCAAFPWPTGLNYFRGWLTKGWVFDTASEGQAIIANGHFLQTSKREHFKETALVKLPGEKPGKQRNKSGEELSLFITLEVAVIKGVVGHFREVPYSPCD